MEENVSIVSPRDYYTNLQKKDKTKFLNFLIKKYEFNYSTLRNKLARNSLGELSKLEKIAIERIILTEEWKQ